MGVDLVYEARGRNRGDRGETQRSVDARLRVVTGTVVRYIQTTRFVKAVVGIKRVRHRH